MPPPAATTDENRPAGGIRVDILRSADGLASLEEEWRALEQRAADPLTYFQSFDWCSTWCRFNQDGADPCGIRIVTARSRDRLVLVWPLMLTGSSWTVRRMLPLTMPHGQYGNMIVDPDLQADGPLRATIEECLSRLVAAENPDLVSFADVPAGGEELPSAFDGAGQIECAGKSAWMDLTQFEDFDDYNRQLTRSVRKGRKRKRNALDGLGRIEHVVRHGGEAGFGELVRAGVEMKRIWLQETGRPTRVVNRADFADFLGALPHDPETGNGALASAITLDGRPIAVEIGFRWYGRFYSYLGSFDWELRDYSPGKVQLEEAIRWCLEQGIEAYDLLGEPAAYKSGWSNMSTSLKTYRLEPTLRGKAFASVWSRSIRPAAKSMMQAAPLGLRTRLAPIAERISGAAEKSA
ncbi:MAG: hypothetical protein CL534_11595 [Ahrensia sp.]|nr:hypothetical protein [Ahrensia sp.]